MTGGGSGFGRAIAEQCAGRGYSVALLDIDGSRAGSEAEALAAEHGVGSLGLRVDVGDQHDVEMAANVVERDLGAADLVFSNVGVQQIGALERFSDEAWAWMLDVNVVGAARVTRSFLPLLRRSENPRLVFTASSSVLVPASRLAAYQASKFAVLGLAETLRLELAEQGIGVSVIFPSGMMNAPPREQPGRSTDGHHGVDCRSRGHRSPGRQQSLHQPGCDRGGRRPSRGRRGPGRRALHRDPR